MGEANDDDQPARIDAAKDDLGWWIGEHSGHIGDGLDHRGHGLVERVADRQADLDLGATCVVLGVVDEGLLRTVRLGMWIRRRSHASRTTAGC